MEHTVPFIFQWDETFDVGLDTGTPVSLIEYHYDCPFSFTGKIDKLTYRLGSVQMPQEGQQTLQKAAERIAQGKD